MPGARVDSQSLALQESLTKSQDFATSLEYSQHTENQPHEL